MAKASNEYVLKKPVNVAGEIRESVFVKTEWSAGDFIDIQNAGDKKGDQAAQQIAIAIDWPVPFVRQLSIEDYIGILELSNSFFAKTMPGKK